MKQPRNTIYRCKLSDSFSLLQINGDGLGQSAEIARGRTERSAIRAGIRRLQRLTRELEKMEAKL